MFVQWELEASGLPYVVVHDNGRVGLVVCVMASHIMVKFNYDEHLYMIRHCDCYYNKGNPCATRKNLH
jgi:hypothetical protein